MSAVLAAAGAALAVLAAVELWGEWGERVRTRAGRRLGRGWIGRPLAGLIGAAREEALRLRLRRAGLDRRLGPRVVVGLRVLTGVAALPLALSLAPVAPGRSGLLVAIGVPLGASFLPDVVIERIAVSRRARIAATLPDALELMASGATAGRSHAALLAGASTASPLPLRNELAALAASLRIGGSQSATLAAFARESGGELATLAARLDRSRRLGAPLAAGLQRQALGLREQQARRIAEEAARAAPKIQLAVALLLVPSVLLIVAAAVIANADSLLVGY